MACDLSSWEVEVGGSGIPSQAELHSIVGRKDRRREGEKEGVWSENGRVVGGRKGEGRG